jgi:hypothetical protein
MQVPNTPTGATLLIASLATQGVDTVFCMSKRILNTLALALALRRFVKTQMPDQLLICRLRHKLFQKD